MLDLVKVQGSGFRVQGSGFKVPGSAQPPAKKTAGLIEQEAQSETQGGLQPGANAESVNGHKKLMLVLEGPWQKNNQTQKPIPC